jgi:hypothetical protein
MPEITIFAVFGPGFGANTYKQRFKNDAGNHDFRGFGIRFWGEYI